MEDLRSTNHTAVSPIQIGDDHYFKISNSDALRPFFMSILSDSNHWMFISSNGGLTAGRKNADYALFPYYTDDKITESAEITGSKSIFHVQKEGKSHIWEPFSYRFEGMYKITRNLYKSVYGNKILFEEENHDLKLTFRYQWNSSTIFGFVKKSTLINNSGEEVRIAVLDGIQNILPYGVPGDLQNSTSNLVDAYKRSELEKAVGLGIYSLSAIIVDKAEPSEALKANIVWSLGLENPKYLLSSLQLQHFRKGMPVREEVDVKAEKGAYFTLADVLLPPNSEKEWMIVADVNKNHSAVAEISESIKSEKQLAQLVQQDIELGTQRLIQLNAASDGLQLTSDELRDTRHFSNTLFNIMRGGIFDHNYQIEKWDLLNYLSTANKKVFKTSGPILKSLPEVFSLSRLQEIAYQTEDKDLRRLCIEYMPLKFSRRHGDPSRPWNKFSINTRSELDGSKILDYEGNWRDIFQNWEALAHSFPEFIESMIHKFLNATTFDGYNPYRITKDGFDWETIEPDNPWSYIGYWGDHQIIYLLKFLEFMENHSPGQLESYFDQELFVYAMVPYRIKRYEDILHNPKDTIEFDEELDRKIRLEREAVGADAALLRDSGGTIYTTNFIEKILATVLAKLSNFIPEGGIWMNTQRPEWNDANNALVGNGVSMVTLYYLRRFLKFLEKIVVASNVEEVHVSTELVDFFDRVVGTFEQYLPLLAGKITDKDRKRILDGVGQAGSAYRLQVYERAFSGKKRTVSLKDLANFVTLSLQYLENSIHANKREDDLYHAYNLMTVENEDEISISYLSEMLEGQVAVLSSGYLSSREALDLLDGLKRSSLFREDQYSYILYPNKDLPRFTQKNTIPKEAVEGSALLTELVRRGNVQLIEKDIHGVHHFNGNFKNANDVRAALALLAQTSFGPLVEKDKKLILQIFEKVFNHKAFTGRSGTFFGYEGLGSIYWHMVSKLQLAVQECCLKAIEEQASEKVIGRLLEHYYEINEGIGVHKPPSLYGAFSTDPYSHTPAGKGAQQPGMTGQVKEDILCRFGELGVFVRDGKLYFNPCLLRREEFLLQPRVFKYIDVHQASQQLQLEAGSLCFTYCQVPVVYKLADTPGLEVKYQNNASSKFETWSLDTMTSKKIFERTGEVVQLIVHIKEAALR
ncbi:MAG: hypothetical protein IPL49_19145 [Saprospirales bacterium]|nr:hypothetical protein [Saprospirales bacterium]